MAEPLRGGCTQLLRGSASRQGIPNCCFEKGDHMASISIQDMSVSYNRGKSYVLDKLNLEVKDGEFCVFLGPSGCGKSTAMHCIAGLLHPVHGEIRFGDDVMTRVSEGSRDKTFVPPQERNIAMVFQEYALYPNMTVRENMSFALKTKKAPKEEINKRVDYMARMLSIEQLLDRRPAELSGGQRQRVALGRALVRDPQVFLLDEPLGNLDAKLRDQVRYELKKIQLQLGITTIYVTHDQTEAMTMASRIVVMKDGFVQQVDTPQNLYDYPANLFVAGFIGSPQMNFFTVKLVKEGNDVAAVFGDNKIIIPPSKLAKFADEDYIGKEVYMGIRPENIHDEDVFIQAAPNAVVDCNVEVTELMGSETYLYLSTSGKEENIIARVNPRTTSRAGQKVQIAFDVNHLHFFDKETETTLLTR